MPTDTRTCGEISCDECNERYAAVCKQLTQLRAERDEAVGLLGGRCGCPVSVPGYCGWCQKRNAFLASLRAASQENKA